MMCSSVCSIHLVFLLWNKSAFLPLSIIISFLCKQLLCCGRNVEITLSFLCCLFNLNMFSYLLIAPLCYPFGMYDPFLYGFFFLVPVSHLSVHHVTFSTPLLFFFPPKLIYHPLSPFFKSSHSNLCTKSLEILHVLDMTGQEWGLEFVHLLCKIWGRCSVTSHHISKNNSVSI